jgi:cytoskeletal protein CcmA (bactofilin family)
VKLYFFKEKPMKTGFKLFSLFTLLAIFSMAIATPVLAFDGRTGDDIVIESDEVINDDLYVTAENFTLDGTIKGDLFVMGNSITINGTVEGDLFAGGETIVINGTVNGDTSIGGAALQLGETAVLGEDLLAGGASLETKDGSTTGGDLLVGSGQTLLAGDVAGDVFAGTGALELRGEFGGDVTAEVGDSTEDQPAPSMYMPNVKISLPSVRPGFTVSKDAVIKGDLVYTQSSDVTIPSNVVAGKITRNEPTTDIEYTYVAPTAAEVAMDWTFDLFRTIATIILLGLLLGWLAPKFVNLLGEKIKDTPIASVGWGVVAWAAFFFTLLLIVVVMVIGALFFGVLTLGGVSFWIVLVGLLSIFALCTGFGLVIFFLAQIVVAWLGGKMILTRLNPKLAESKIWPLVLGAVLVALVTSVPLVGPVFSILIVLAGLGAFWIWGQEARQSRQIAVV